MRYFWILLFYSSTLFAQDKLFFKNGTSRKGIIVTNAKDYVYFRNNDTSAVEKIKKDQLLLMEDYRGNRFLFSDETGSEDPAKLRADKNNSPRNILSVQPLALLFGRANFSYERLTKDQKIGIVVPIILTYEPSFGSVYNFAFDTSRAHVNGLNFISGLDLNFYFGKKEFTKLFIGPRIRFGTDVAFLNTEAYSLQTQLGVKVGNPDRSIVQHLSIGFGFVRVISSPVLLITDNKQLYPWFSLNYRLGVKW
jgi:hypothetical protein